ncbi:hypothetical protein L3X38_008958 [Prunus dulcis]|uniref:Uncharacterized protein n=1 Tax=Prunus dulcis TaxID=3755 RepID=A0AAD4ZXH0_PRUDU|nr:hypothetical protein L3X38_008958 [Prunus dulcis]
MSEERQRAGRNGCNACQVERGHFVFLGAWSGAHSAPTPTTTPPAPTTSCRRSTAPPIILNTLVPVLMWFIFYNGSRYVTEFCKSC